MTIGLGGLFEHCSPHTYADLRRFVSPIGEQPLSLTDAKWSVLACELSPFYSPSQGA
jgi:hypothetical protein